MMTLLCSDSSNERSVGGVVRLNVACFPWDLDAPAVPTDERRRTDCSGLDIACRLGVLPQCASFRAVAMSCVHTTGSPGEEKIYAFVMISYAIASLFMIVIMSGINGRINLFCCFCFVNF